MLLYSFRFENKGMLGVDEMSADNKKVVKYCTVNTNSYSEEEARRMYSQSNKWFDNLWELTGQFELSKDW